MDAKGRIAPSEPGRTPDLGARYRSLFEIGRGGMGTIEVALERAAGGFERIVALKRMHPVSVRDRRHSEMFLREARLAVWLTHANVVHAFD
ncbi:MAG TPA: serine/threonine protein kinase, partial [Polyangiaceae bacterium]